MNISVKDVAQYILECVGEITCMKLQKLVYYSQSWNIVWEEKALFPEKIEAWANGPVTRDLYELHKGHFRISTLKEFGADSSKLSKKQKDNIDKVLEFYGKKSAQWLSDLTHNELPWVQAREGLAMDERGSNEITLASMEEYYSSLC